MIRLVIFDADDTLWTVGEFGGSISFDSVPPYKKIDSHSIKDSQGKVITLNPGALELLRELKKRKIFASTATHNEPYEFISAFRIFGIGPLFTFPQVGWEDKDQMILELISIMNKHDIDIKAEEIIYIDDRVGNIRLVSGNKKLKGIKCLRMWVDLQDFRDVLEML